MKNPIRELREQKGMGQAGFANLLGLNAQVVQRHEYGSYRKLTPSMREALQGAGYDADIIDRKLSEWVAAQRGNEEMVREARKDFHPAGKNRSME